MRIGLIHREHPRHMQHRMIGMWSYDVPEFDVIRLPQPRNFELNVEDYYGKVDVLFWEDARTVGKIVGDRIVPVAYYVGDSTLSDEHFQHRFSQSRQADIIFVDWDKLYLFRGCGIPVHRLSYCVNDRLFSPKDKRLDVGFFASMTDERRELFMWLKDFCKQRGYSFDGGRREKNDYIDAISTAKVNINLNRNSLTRAHRCFDVMASHSCLITSPMPRVSGEDWQPGLQYWNFRTFEHLETLIDSAINSQLWAFIAHCASEYSKQQTWSFRAKQLHAILKSFLR